MSDPSCQKFAEETHAKNNVSLESPAKVVADVGDWVEIEIGGEENDDWVQV